MSGGHILGPQDVPRRRRIFVPSGYEDRQIVRKCLVPGCGQEFARGQEAQAEAHAVRCARANLDTIRAMAPSEANKGTVFGPEHRDLEMEAHFREVRQRMEREGRREILPNEAAGH